MTRQPQILVISNTTSDGEMVGELLQKEFHQVEVCTDPDEYVRIFDRAGADVLVLAFQTLKSAERHYLGLLKHAVRMRGGLHRTILLCVREEVKEAYHLCRRQHFDDYVLFWPISHDPHRLYMAVHQASRAIAAAEKHGPHTGVFALRTHDVGAEEEQPITPETAPEASVPAASTASVPSRGGLVLLVDDDPFQQKLIAAALAGSGLTLEAASSPGEAFRYLERNVPDVILMDYELPEMSGLEITRRLRQSSRLVDVPVVMLTGHSTKEVAMGSLSAGAADFIVKPFERDTLLRKLRAQLP